MFNKAIHNTVMNSEAANRLFSSITTRDTPDQSFLATLRALVHKRISQDESVFLACKALRFSAYQFRNYSTPERIESIFSGEQNIISADKYTIQIFYVTDEEIGEEFLSFIKDAVGDGKRYLGSFSRQDDLQVFYARKVKSLFYMDEESRNAVIFLSRMELKHFHALQMMIPKYLPKLFSGKELTKTEIELLKSLGNKSAVDYESILIEFSKDLDFRSELIRVKLSGFETQYERLRLEEIKTEISRYQQDYDTYLASMREMARKIQDSLHMLAGLESSIKEQSGDSELVEYFMCNKNLTVIRAYKMVLEFVAHGYADIYDEDAFSQYVANRNGYMYVDINPNVTKSQMEKLYSSIFSRGIYKLRICASYTVDMRNGLKANQNYVFPEESQTHFPNPHIQQYGCIGTYAGRFQEYMNRKDYVGAIDQAVVSARNINFYDSSVMSGFARTFSRTTIKCLEKSDGSLLSPQEAIIELEGGIV